MSKKIYAVKNGRVPGIYLNWEECKVQVDGYSGAIYKSFGNADDALEYIGAVKNKEAPECEVKAYVDGSYDVRTGDYSYGMVVLLSDGNMSIPIEISILFGNSEHPFPERKNMPFRSRVQPFI